RAAPFASVCRRTSRPAAQETSRNPSHPAPHAANHPLAQAYQGEPSQACWLLLPPERSRVCSSAVVVRRRRACSLAARGWGGGGGAGGRSRPPSSKAARARRKKRLRSKRSWTPSPGASGETEERASAATWAQSRPARRAGEQGQRARRNAPARSST